MPTQQRIRLTVGLVALAHYAAGPSWNTPVLDAILLAIGAAFTFAGLPRDNAKQASSPEACAQSDSAQSAS